MLDGDNGCGDGATTIITTTYSNEGGDYGDQSDDGDMIS